MTYVLFGQIVHLYDLLIAVGALICIIGAFFPMPGIPGGTRAGFFIFGLILAGLFFFAASKNSFSYPVIVLAAPLIAVVQLFKVIGQAFKTNRDARNPMLNLEGNQGYAGATGYDTTTGYGTPTGYDTTTGYETTTTTVNTSYDGATGYGTTTSTTTTGYGDASNSGAAGAYGAAATGYGASAYSAPAAPSAGSINDGNYTVAHAADPGASPHTLSEIARTSPHLHAQLATNPATSPELLDWLAAAGSHEVQQAVALRRSQSY